MAPLVPTVLLTTLLTDFGATLLTTLLTDFGAALLTTLLADLGAALLTTFLANLGAALLTGRHTFLTGRHTLLTGCRGAVFLTPLLGRSRQADESGKQAENDKLHNPMSIAAKFHFLLGIKFFSILKN